MSEEKLCPICGKPTANYYGKYNKYGLCNDHSRQQKNGEIEKEFYTPIGYRKMLKGYQKSLETFVENTKLVIVGNTLQVKDYSRFNPTGRS